MINHSCVPNISFDFLGEYAFLRANKEIKKSDELFVSYGANHVSLEDRKNFLKSWGIDCKC